MVQTRLTVCADCSAAFQAEAGRTPPGRRCYFQRAKYSRPPQILHPGHVRGMLARAQSTIVTRAADGLGELKRWWSQSGYPGCTWMRGRRLLPCLAPGLLVLVLVGIAAGRAAEQHA